MYLLQKEVIRVTSFENSTCPSTPIFSELKILSLYDLVESKLLSFFYESINKVSPIFFHYFFETLKSFHHYNTRQASKGDIFVTHGNALQFHRLVYLLRELFMKKFLT